MMWSGIATDRHEGFALKQHLAAAGAAPREHYGSRGERCFADKVSPALRYESGGQEEKVAPENRGA
jgi:hypothetical protein